MDQILYEWRCKCKETLLITKKREKKKRRREKIHQYPGGLLRYPNSHLDEGLPEVLSKTFCIQYKKTLSLNAKCILNSFQNKYIYYAIDDILSLSNSNLEEKDYLLEVLYSPILSLHNNFSINFFDIWIHEIYIDELSKSNRFLKSPNEILTQTSIITLKLFYKLPIPVKKRATIW